MTLTLHTEKLGSVYVSWHRFVMYLTNKTLSLLETVNRFFGFSVTASLNGLVEVWSAAHLGTLLLEECRTSSG